MPSIGLSVVTSPKRHHEVSGDMTVMLRRERRTLVRRAMGSLSRGGSGSARQLASHNHLAASKCLVIGIH